jgi:enediyne biosynthesis protein E4
LSRARTVAWGVKPRIMQGWAADDMFCDRRESYGDAVVRLWVGKTVMVRQVNPAGGYLSHSSSVVHFGLGDRSKVDRVEIRWPRGIVQTLDNPEINALHQIREPAQ